MSATLTPAVEFDALRDRSYRRAKLGADVAAYLAWKELGGASPITVENYERALATFCRMYPNTAVGEVTDAQLGQVFRRFPARSRRVRVAPYKDFFKWAVQSHRVDRGANPMDMIPEIRKPPRRKPDVFSDAEVETLLGLDVVDAAPLAVMFDAGLRRAECCRLQLRHCLPESGYVKVVDGKGGKDRRVPMSVRLQQLLADLEILEGLSRDDHIFYAERANATSRRRVRRFDVRNTRNGTEYGVGEGTFSRWWYRCLDDAGIAYVKRNPATGEPGTKNPHTARHTFATSWRRRGLAIDDIAAVMGHTKSSLTFELYAQIEPEDVAVRMALIEAGERG